MTKYLFMTFNIFFTMYFLFIITLVLKAVFRLYFNNKEDKALNIKTGGIRRNSVKVYNRTESTPYLALKTLVENYSVDKDSAIVDYGSGKGRVTFYLSKHYNIPVTGIEINETTYSEAEDNLESYKDVSSSNSELINFEYEYAEDYDIKVNENIFFFFHPFKIEVFEKVANNIIKHSQENDKPVDIILYFRIPEFEKYLEGNQFELVEEFKSKGALSHFESFRIYRLGN